MNILKNILIYILILQFHVSVPGIFHKAQPLLSHTLRPKASAISVSFDRFSDTLSLQQDIIEQAKQDLAKDAFVERIEGLCNQSFDGKPDRDKWGIFFATPTIWGLQIVEYIKRNWPAASVCDLGSGDGKFAFLARSRV
jgi:hypothetical protein